jgi:hypothetical protein
VIETRDLQHALAGWRHSPAELLATLGYEPVGLSLPAARLADFGLDPAEPLALELAARQGSFHVFRIALAQSLDPETVRRVAAGLYRHNPARRALLVFEARDDASLVFASWGLGPGPFRLRKLWLDPISPRASELDVLTGLAAESGATACDLAVAHARALDREQLTRQFFQEFRERRAELARALAGPPETAEQDRLDLALLLLGRLLFLHFIQRKGWLAGDAAYLRRLWEGALADGVPFYRRRLRPLFFGALNRPPDQRKGAARELGVLPYLNGGLFEPDVLERRYPRLDVPDESFAPVFHDLLDRYQFTLREDTPADQDVAIDPEMLGKVFEGLMAGPQRGASGAFFTPRPLVDRLVEGALAAHLARATGCDARLIEDLFGGGEPALEPTTRERLAACVRRVRVLDPAVGSGAFLLAALQRLEALHDVLEGRPVDGRARFLRRQAIIQRNLHGVDVSGAAVRLCELRLWLALVMDLEVAALEAVPPLPNLDINIRQGDALIDPIDFLTQLGDLDAGALAGRWQRTARGLAERRARYFHAKGPGKRRAQRNLRRGERELALSFLAELAAQLDARLADLRAAARSRDLFGRRAGLTPRQRRHVAALRRRKAEAARLVKRIRELEELPFFSFPVHFAEGDEAQVGFNVLVGNPPWVRAHRWAGPSRHRLRERYRVLREAGWRVGSALAGAGRGFGAQLDLSAIFLERSLELLAADGALGMLLPAKLVRGLAAGALRRRLRDSTRLLRIEDFALTPARLFEATTYPLSLLLAGGRPGAADDVEVIVHDRSGELLDFRLPQGRLPLLPDEAEAPWALAPADVRDVLDRMRAAGPALGSQPGRRPLRGVFTGDNDAFVGVLAGGAGGAGGASRNGRVRLRFGEEESEIEAERLRPALRGEDLAPWRFEVACALIWTHDDDGRALASLPPGAREHLSRHERALKARADLRRGRPHWAIFRAQPAKWGPRVAWRDIAPEPGAVVVPRRVRFLGRRVPLISLNTVYQIPAASGEDAHLLAAVLNSTVARAYLKAIAERASGGYFRFLSWTVALLPLPTKPDAAARSSLVALSRAAHAAGALPPPERERLDRMVARIYGLQPAELELLSRFDARLSNASGGA